MTVGRRAVELVLCLTVLALAGCSEPADQPSVGPSAPTPVPAVAPSLDTEDYCALHASIDEMDGSPYDPELYAATSSAMRRAAAGGPPDLADEWATLAAAFEVFEAAAVEADLGHVSEATAFEIVRAQVGEAEWPDGVDRAAVEEFDRTIASVNDDALAQADDAISEHARGACPSDD